jgi:NTP pyrophosphatase (non-canonical NTP hydrolase)
VELNDYQARALASDQKPGTDGDAVAIPMLGLAGEVGALLAEYKKQLRDGPGHLLVADRVREELGDVLWYLANLAAKYGLSLDEVAQQNLTKTGDRWLDGHSLPDFFDDGYPEQERLPRQFEVHFNYDTSTGHPRVVVSRDGSLIGNPLTDNSYNEDGYRFHDAYHFSFAALLGWSPVTRRNLRRKRKSQPMVDEVEDGGRGWVIEEGIAALSFAYATEHGFFEDTHLVDESLLRTVQVLTSTVEVRVRSAREWERAIVTGSRLWKQLRDHDGGTLRGSLADRTIQYELPVSS